MESLVKAWTIRLCVLIAVCSFVAPSSGYVPNDLTKSLGFENETNSAKQYIGHKKQQDLNETCEVQSAIDEFPADLFTQEQLERGAVLLHIFAAIYSFIFLACLCNYYFLPAVECVCEDFNIPKDVAAAIVMATATAMPEFFTNTVSTLITDSDMGLGNVIGSLMFNTLGVAAVSGLCVRKPLQLDWWPVCRDCTIYFFHICVLMVVAWGGEISLALSGVMIFLLVLYYFTIIITNYKLKNRLRTFVEDHMNCCSSTRYDLTLPVEHSAKGQLQFHKTLKDRRQSGIYVITPTEFISSSSARPLKRKSFKIDGKSGEPSSAFRLPREASVLGKIWWVYVWPIRFILSCMCPNPITNRRLYPLTFVVCIIFIGVNSYFMVWMLTVFGSTFGIPDVVMGLTILSAGGATPEGFSSAVSARRGESGIGVSNSLGSNTLAILLSLGVPWFIKCAINLNTTGGIIYINSNGIEYVVGILMISTITLFVILAISGFRLGKTVGIVLSIAYFVLIALQVMIEMDVFYPNPNGC